VGVSEHSATRSRVDVWLWCVRVHKTRQLAKQACLSGHVTVNGAKAKPATVVTTGSVVQVVTRLGKKTFSVLATPGSRVSASDVAAFARDVTPPGDIVTPLSRKSAGVSRERGLGRPTKKDRRAIDKWRGG
jgi:ribosome-associated heat shock protein Hsp15